MSDLQLFAILGVPLMLLGVGVFGWLLVRYDRPKDT